jgi:SAM-dependent methyltransferase
MEGSPVVPKDRLRECAGKKVQERFYYNRIGTTKPDGRGLLSEERWCAPSEEWYYIPHPGTQSQRTDVRVQKVLQSFARDISYDGRRRPHMRESRKFDPRSIDKLNNPERFGRENPDVIWKELGLSAPRVLVDIGAGTGFFAVPFARKGPEITVHALDLQDEMLAWLTANLPEDVRTRVLPAKMEESAVPLPDGIADLVYMINLHHELEDRDAMMAECFRVLKSGGTVLVVDWTKGETPGGPPQEIRMEEEEISDDMKRAGFKDIRKHPVLPYHSFVTAKKP